MRLARTKYYAFPSFVGLFLTTTSRGIARRDSITTDWGSFASVTYYKGRRSTMVFSNHAVLVVSVFDIHLGPAPCDVLCTTDQTPRFRWIVWDCLAFHKPSNDVFGQRPVCLNDRCPMSDTNQSLQSTVSYVQSALSLRNPPRMILLLSLRKGPVAKCHDIDNEHPSKQQEREAFVLIVHVRITTWNVLDQAPWYNTHST